MKKIDPDILVAELAELYPEVVNFLIYEYEFHCIGCYISQFETLRQGAEVHGILGKDFEEMIARANELINASAEEKKAVKSSKKDKIKTHSSPVLNSSVSSAG